MSTTEPLEAELKAFEHDLARLVARFLKLYDRLEAHVRPASAPLGAPPTVARAQDPPLLPGYH